MQRIFIREFKKFCKGVQGEKLFQLPEWRRSRFPYAEFTRFREIDSRAKGFPLHRKVARFTGIASGFLVFAFVG